MLYTRTYYTYSFIHVRAFQPRDTSGMRSSRCREPLPIVLRSGACAGQALTYRQLRSGCRGSLRLLLPPPLPPPLLLLVLLLLLLLLLAMCASRSKFARRTHGRGGAP